MSLHKTLIAAVATLGLLAGSAMADDRDAARTPLHAVSRGHDVAARPGYAPAYRPVVRPEYHHGRHTEYPREYRPVCRPAPRAYRTYEVRPTVHHHSEACRFAAGHYETVVRDVVIPGHYIERDVPPRYEVRWDSRHGGFVSILVSPRQVIREWVPRSIERRRESVWVESRWSCGG